MTNLPGHANVWTFLLSKLNAGIPSALLLVLVSHGSSPGRQGFKMGVSLDGDLVGSIGGGIMEHKLVELARAELKKESKEVEFLRQVHKAESSNDRSGMICSGEQTVVIIPLPESALPDIQNIEESFSKNQRGVLEVSDSGFSFSKAENPDWKYEVKVRSKKKWTYRENIGARDLVHIIGGGHVGKALSRQLVMLGFFVKIYDNREYLNTLETNEFAHEKVFTSFGEIGNMIPSNKREYVVIMSFGYRDDKVVLKQFLGKEFKYLGMMGSAAKVEQLMKELVNEGYRVEDLEKVFAPIGIQISSKTPEEIAVSIAAEIVRIKNRGL